MVYTSRNTVVKYHVKRRENKEFVILETAQLDNLLYIPFINNLKTTKSYLSPLLKRIKRWYSCKNKEVTIFHHTLQEQTISSWVLQPSEEICKTMKHWRQPTLAP